jgi:putative chitinase
MNVSTMQLATIFPDAQERIALFVSPLNAAMQEFGITTPSRQAAFLAQVGHESGEMHYTQEIADGGEYEGREDLGNTQPGDGKRFKGRGLLQITGRKNYSDCGDALGVNFLSFPELLTETVNACRSAGWFWRTHGLNEQADSDRFGTITHRINGGYNGLDSRIRFWLDARKALGL